MATYLEGYYADGTAAVWFDDDCIETTVTASGDAAGAWLAETYRALRTPRSLAGVVVVGLDVEWRPARVLGPVAVLQLCVDHRCLVFQILRADHVPAILRAFLADRRFTLVGVGIRDDAARLWAGYGLHVARAADLRRLAADAMGRPDLLQAGLQALVWEVMGVQMEKPYHVRVSAWDAPVLSEDQLVYACVDAFASFEVGRRLYDGEY